MRHRRVTLSVRLACLVALGCIGAAGSLAAAPATGARILFGLSAEPTELDPARYTGTAARTVKLQLYRGLFAYTPAGAVENELVASYAQPDPTTYVFRLRPGLRFSDGTPLTSADVVFTFERIADPKVGAYLKGRLANVTTVTAPDPATVRVTLKAPDAAFLQVLAAPEAAIVSRAFTQAHDGDLKAVALGAGPYRLVEWQRGVQITVGRNPVYHHAGRPHTPVIRFVFYPDDNSRVAGLESGAVDAIEYVPWQDIDAVRTRPGLRYQGTNGPFMYVMFNLTRPPFSDARVRQAIGYAVDREAVVKTAFFGHGSAIYGLPIPSGSLAYDPRLARYYAHDPAKAKQLLTEAGFANGFTATLLSTAQYGMHRDTAQVVQQALNLIGNHITLSLPDWATRVSLGLAGRYEFAVQGAAGDYNDPDWLSALFHSGPTNIYSDTGYAAPQMDALLDEARATLNPSRRKLLYGRMQALALQESPYVFLTWREQGYAYKDTLSGFENLPGFLTFYSGYTLQDVAVRQ